MAGDIAGALVDARSIEREKQLNAELRALDEHRLAMIGTIAHELQNPVGVLSGHLDLIGMVDLPPMVRRSLEAMGRASARIEAMTHNLVALGKVTDADQPLRQDEVPLTTLVHDALEFVRVLAESAGIELSREVAQDVTVTGDPVELQRLVANLVGNAIKYTPRGGRVHAGLRVDVAAQEVELLIRDTGLGIAASDMDHLFDPFFRSRDERAKGKPGTGLGLAIVKRVVDRHRGRIEVSSRWEVGTDFRVWLPHRVSTP